MVLRALGDVFLVRYVSGPWSKAQGVGGVYVNKVLSMYSITL